MKRVNTVPEPVPDKPLLPMPTSPTQQSESEHWRHEMTKPERSHPYDKGDSIVDREIDGEE